MSPKEKAKQKLLFTENTVRKNFPGSDVSFPVCFWKGKAKVKFPIFKSLAEKQTFLATTSQHHVFRVSYNILKEPCKHT